MISQKIACMFAAGLIGTGLVATATGAHAKRPGDVTVVATDPELQRKVSYADLNLAVKPDQRVLKRRISYTAGDLCIEINGWDDGSCKTFAINSTRDQVRLAIARAEQQAAGFAVGPPIAISMAIAIR